MSNKILIAEIFNKIYDKILILKTSQNIYFTIDIIFILIFYSKMWPHRKQTSLGGDALTILTSFNICSNASDLLKNYNEEVEM